MSDKETMAFISGLDSRESWAIIRGQSGRRYLYNRLNGVACGKGVHPLIQLRTMEAIEKLPLKYEFVSVGLTWEQAIENL